MAGLWIVNNTPIMHLKVKCPAISSFYDTLAQLFLKYNLIESNGLWIVTTPIMHLKCPASSS